MAEKKHLKIAHIIAEIAPFSKIGGLGDVGRDLPKALLRLDQEIIVISPYYSLVRKQELQKEKIEGPSPIEIDGIDYPVSFRKHSTAYGLTVYFVVNEELFGSHQNVYDQGDDDALRWIFFSKASLELLKHINFQADIIHAHDWTAGLVPNYVNSLYRDDLFFKKSALVFTIHNLSHQGTLILRRAPTHKIDKGTGSPPEQRSFRNYINFMKRGIVNAQVINTVSERYAKEILTPQFGAGLDPYLRRRREHVFGIINGIDYEVVNPAFDGDVYVKYDFNSLEKKGKNKAALQKEVGLTVKQTTPLIGLVNRLSQQKGFALIMEAMPVLLKMDLQMVVVGSGNKDYLKFFREIARKHRSKIGVYSPFTQVMASRVYAGSDLYLMPSRYEPCGISQLISLRYGSIPIVHSV